VTAGALQRHHVFEGISNFRDLGGYPTRFGAPTRPGVVFRSGSPAGMTALDREKLAALGVIAIFDLRSFVEVERDGAVDLADIGISRYHTPVFPDVDVSPAVLAARYRLYSRDVPQVYLQMLRTGAASYRRVAEGIAETRGAVMFHCAGGKDRAGVLAALLLSLAGVDRESVIADYALTSQYLPVPAAERMDHFCKMYGLSSDEFLALFAAQPLAMAATLNRIELTYGSAEGYLRSIGVTEATIERLRARLLSDA